MHKASHAQEDQESARRKAEEAESKLRDLWLDRPARIVADNCEETLTCYDFPLAYWYWRNQRTNNPLERLNRESRRRTRGVASFSDGDGVPMLVSTWHLYLDGQK